MMNHEPAATLLHKDIGGLHAGAKKVFVKRGRDVFIANHPGILARQVNLGVADTDLQSALAAEDRFPALLDLLPAINNFPAGMNASNPGIFRPYFTHFVYVIPAESFVKRIIGRYDFQLILHDIILLPPSPPDTKKHETKKFM